MKQSRNQQFIADVRQKARHNGVKLKFTRSASVKSDVQCAGYFASDPPQLVVAAGVPFKNFLPILVHESCHCDQFLDDRKFWDKNISGVGVVFDWISGKDFNRNTLRNSIKKVINLELDCEIRSIKAIEEYGLNIDTAEYIRKANAYIMSYSYMYLKNNRKWQSSIYSNPDVWSCAPLSFFGFDHMQPTKKLVRAFDKYFKYNGSNG